MEKQDPEEVPQQPQQIVQSAEEGVQAANQKFNELPPRLLAKIPTTDVPILGCQLQHLLEQRGFLGQRTQPRVLFPHRHPLLLDGSNSARGVCCGEYFYLYKNHF